MYSVDFLRYLAAFAQLSDVIVLCAHVGRFCFLFYLHLMLYKHTLLTLHYY